MIPASLNISCRIKSIVGQIEYPRIADIGCDHGYISIYSVSAGIAQNAIACDLNTGPVKRAARNIGKYCADKVQIRQGNGLEPLKPGEVDTVVIAGMGGMLIIDILGQLPRIIESIRQLVLQPQHDIPEVRKYIHRTGFMIKNEIMLREDGKYYNILNCVRGGDSSYSGTDYLLGKILIERSDPVLSDYLKKQIESLRKVRSSIINCGAKTDSSAARLKEIDSLLTVYEELIACQ